MGTPIWAIEGVALDSAGDLVTGSLGDICRIMGAYFSEKIEVYPTLAAGIAVVSDNTDWGLGALATIIPANQVAVPYYLHAVVLESSSKNGVFEMALYQGGGDVEVARIRFALLGGFFGNYYVLSGPLIPANARIRAAVACDTGLAAAATLGVSLCYHRAL